MGMSCHRCNDTGLIGTGRYHEREACDCAADEPDEPDVCPPTIVDEEPDCPDCGRTLSAPYNACPTPSWVCGWVSEDYEPSESELEQHYGWGSR